MKHLIIGLLLVLSTPAPAPVSVSTTFNFGFAPATVRVRIHVEPNPDNRLLCLEYDGGKYRRSCQDHIGVDAPQSIFETLKNLPAGAYTFAAQIIRKDNSFDIATIQFEVLESATP